MKSVSFNPTALSFIIGKSIGKLTEKALFRPISGIRFEDVKEPELPGNDWVRLEILKAGICGTDIGALSYNASAIMEPFGSMPAVLGHEILARIIEIGPGVRSVEVGQRVIVDPLISCTMRGFSEDERCPSCKSGDPGTCERAGDEGELMIDGVKLPRGASIGYHATLSGGWAERMIAHESQLYPIDDRLDDRTAVLIEPISVGMHAVLGERSLSDGPVLVIGSGPIALGTIWSLRAIGYEGELVAQVEPGRRAEIARELGASSVVSPGQEARQALIDTGAQAYKPIIGDEVYAGGGFPLIFDCVGSEQTIKQSLRYASSRGRIAMLGCAYEISKLDLTFMWARELDIKGYVGYGLEDWRGERKHTFQITQELLLETGTSVDQMVTHIFPLTRYQDALSTAAKRRNVDAIKVLFDPMLS